MKYIKLFESYQHYEVSNLSDYLSRKKVNMRSASIKQIVKFLVKNGFIRLDPSDFMRKKKGRFEDKNLSDYFKYNSYIVNRYGNDQIQIQLKNHLGQIKIMEDDDEWFHVSLTTWETKYYKADQLDSVFVLLTDLFKNKL